MRYQFLIDTYETERIKTLSVWSMFGDEDMGERPNPSDTRGRNLHEQMVHQCVSEDFWFRTMLGIDVNAPPLPEEETRYGFIRRYSADSDRRVVELRQKSDAWWEECVNFFGAARERTWVMVRRISHTSHHRGQQMAMLRMLGHDVHSNYGPTADTGGLMSHNAPVIYAYPDVETLLDGITPKAALPGPGVEPPTERAAALEARDGSG